MEWFEEWFDENYLKIYAHRDEKDARLQIRLILNNITINPANNSNRGEILDLGCGVGRHIKIFKDLGYKAVGIDLSKKLIEIGRSTNPQLNLQVGNALYYTKPQNHPGYYLITSFFTSWGYYNEDGKNLAILKQVYSNLSKGGFFWLDFMNSVQVRQQFGRAVHYNNFSFKENIRIEEKKFIQANRIIKKIKIITFDNSSPENEKVKLSEKNYFESIRLYDENEIRIFFNAIGFKVVEIFGDYKGNEFNQLTSKRLIFLVQK